MSPKLSGHATRNPHKAIKKSRQRAALSEASKASKVLATALRKERQMLLEDDVDEFYAYRAGEIVRLATKHSVTPDTVRKMICNTTQFKTTRALNLRNAIMHDRAVKAKAAGESKSLGELQDDILAAVEDGELEVSAAKLDQAEKKRLIDQLIAYRETQRHGARATNKAAAMNGVATAAGVRDVLIDLFERTGIRALALFSRGNPDNDALPNCVDSDESKGFFESMLKTSYLDILRSFERYCCTRDNGLHERNDLDSVRKDIVLMIMEGLRK
ncbi:hypothetical protein B0H17DRAFT_931362 [Mycena rosella]|uniref:Uncharacterized protein n=1 Tax=Mycena rosella TaxID=1033263 RepID=A0AAD7DQ29_MYCRO|nr:hypothetical protein B0H17DRAFT_931362 [Mycena rosella]